MWLPLLVVLGLLLLYRWYRFSLILENVTDKYVFITGCDTGFGNLLAKQLDRRGMRVLAACLTQEGAENLKKETSGRLQTAVLDISDPQSVSSAAKWVDDIVSDQGLWGLVNNAGIGLLITCIEWQTKEDFKKILDVNLLGTIDVTLKMLPLVRRAKGRVINMSSITGRVSFVGGGYSPAKFGLEAFSDELRREMISFGVKVSIIEPGYFKTQMSDPDLLIKTITNLWENASEEVRKSYGRQHFDNYCCSVTYGTSKASNKLHLVTDCMEHALTAVHPMTRYSAGWDAKFFYLPVSYLPTVLVDFMVSKAIKRQSNK
ncbi:17-beta-hydroxysteroid dehydrogenase type 6-like [Hyperolius riggenbachi]|uniref:17-beta-hydroxysteroid dehydrogenase type 6-like n=1 Tax=Hyperolius riggenbachi TaxID=752182 RepID=UPI0035A36C8B